MTKEEKLAVFKAYLDGKPIEFRDKTNSELEDFDWRPVSMPSWSFESYVYRIKSEETPADIPTIDWKASYEALQAANKTLQSAYDEMKEQRDALLNTNNLLRSTVDNLKSATYDLNKDCDRADEKIASLRGALNTLHDTLHNAILS